jgi:hypothetical protein
MNLDNKTVWQQAAGDGETKYPHICLKWDVILNGPGGEGAWPDCADCIDRAPRKISDLRRFCDEMQEGDIVILRSGTASVYGVGEVVGNYSWLHEFSNIDGWDLQHVRRVKWLWKAGDNPMQFDSYALKLGDRLKRLI